MPNIQPAQMEAFKEFIKKYPNTPVYHGELNIHFLEDLKKIIRSEEDFELFKGLTSKIHGVRIPLKAWKKDHVLKEALSSYESLKAADTTVEKTSLLEQWISFDIDYAKKS